MAQIAKISKQLELKCSAHNFFDLWRNKFEFVLKMFPDIYTGYEVVEGNGFSHGSIIHLKYNLGGPSEVKERISIDEANKSISFECIEGDVFKYFQEMKFSFQVFENGSDGSSVNWTIDFVKANEDVTPPYDFLIAADKISKGLEDYLCNLN